MSSLFQAYMSLARIARTRYDIYVASNKINLNSDVLMILFIRIVSLVHFWFILRYKYICSILSSINILFLRFENILYRV